MIHIIIILTSNEPVVPTQTTKSHYTLVTFWAYFHSKYYKRHKIQVSTYENWHKSFGQCKHCIVLRAWKKKKVSGNEIILRINPAYHPLSLESWSFSYGQKAKWTEFLFKEERTKIIWSACLEKNRLRKGSLKATRKLHRRTYQHAHAIQGLLMNCLNLKQNFISMFSIFIVCRA